ncbi:ABC transporter ATP-binding protein [Shewanella waksmanii]|uniref:ABC transporter ATP-binding protein n=1 Tax=Shewanella waksmanii TaxID=213783 RepID=UPI0004904761|nr:ATP-binding cassette domain-containing protein [Shewanella waksmanii]
MSDVILSAESVTLEYQSRTGFLKQFTHKAIDDVSFQIGRGEVFGILGRNGSGKSSLLKLLAGTLTPDSGQVVCEPSVTRSLLALGLGFNNNLSGRDNALISCMLNGYTQKEAIPLVQQIGEFSELGQFFDQPVKTYSSGMRSRLGFASAVLAKVDILLIDETLSVGDNAFKQKAENALLKKISGDQTVIFVSHSIQQINKLCSRCLWLEKGKTITVGPTKEVMAKYLDTEQEQVKI